MVLLIDINHRRNINAHTKLHYDKLPQRSNISFFTNSATNAAKRQIDQKLYNDYNVHLILCILSVDWAVIRSLNETLTTLPVLIDSPSHTRVWRVLFRRGRKMYVLLVDIREISAR